MILNLPSSPIVISENFIGCNSEYLEIAGGFISEMSNLEVAMARLEHASVINEEAKKSLKAGVMEFLAGVKDYIIKLWTRFSEWFGEFYRKLRLSLIDREKWLKDNEKTLLDLKDSDLKGHKVKLGDALFETSYEGIVNALNYGAQAQLDEVIKSDEPEKLNFVQKLAREIISKKIQGFHAKEYAKAMHVTIIGEVTEIELNRRVIVQIINAAKKSSDAVKKLDDCKKSFDSFISATKATTESASNENPDVVKRRLYGIKKLSTSFQSFLNATSSSLQKANTELMYALVSASKIAK